MIEIKQVMCFDGPLYGLFINGVEITVDVNISVLETEWDELRKKEIIYNERIGGRTVG